MIEVLLLHRHLTAVVAAESRKTAEHQGAEPVAAPPVSVGRGPTGWDTGAMNGPSLKEHPFAIHLGISIEMGAGLEDEAREAGISVIRLDLAGIADEVSLADYLATVFMYPHQTRDLDAAVDLISDLTWFGNDSGYLIMVEGLQQAGRRADKAFGGILPAVIDRWRSQDRTFVVAINGGSQSFASALKSANNRMNQAGALPWAQPDTGAVPVLDWR